MASPEPLSDGSRRMRDLARCPQMIPGSQPTHVIKDDREQTSEATARPEVRGAVGAGLPGNGGGWAGADAPAVPAVTSGTVMVALQTGQAICVPARAVSHKMS